MSTTTNLPLFFELLNEDETHALTIVDHTDGQHLLLEISNRSGKTIQFQPIPENKADRDNYHFEIRFNPGILNVTATREKIVLAGTAWQIGFVHGSNIETASLYLTKKDGGAFNAGEKISLTLQNVMLAAGGSQPDTGGAPPPEVTQVFFYYRALQYSANGGAVLASEPQIQQMDIVSHRGLKRLPLHVGIIGRHTILNDGSTGNPIKLRFSNTGQVPLNLGAKDFKIAFDVSEDPSEDWAIAKAGQIKAIKISGGEPAFDHHKDTDLGVERVLFPLNDLLPDQIEAGQHVDIVISEIITGHVAGQTNIYVEYYDIPGYWDGRFVLGVEKAPLVYLDHKVGIGSSKPLAPLSIYAGSGKEDTPDSGMHITNDCILFGGKNAGNKATSAQISAGKLQNNSLNIVGMASKTTRQIDFRVDMWAQGGFFLRGSAIVTGSGDGLSLGKPLAPLSIYAGFGKEDTPDSGMHLTNDCLLFGGKNAGKQTNSAQISAGKHQGNSLNIVGMASGTSHTDRRVDMWAEGGFFVRGSAVVGSAGARKGKLTVYSGGPAVDYQNFGWLGGVLSGASKDRYLGFDPNKRTIPASIWAQSFMAANWYLAFSDARIKEIIGPSDSQKDLEVLKKIQVTDYRYRDHLLNGVGIHKKVIGQQIAEVYPQAVSCNHQEVIPDILQPADRTEDGWVALADSSLEAGEKVRIISGDGEELLEVLEVNARGFRVAGEKSGKVLVYGREVDDFHQVDYEALSMLHISATQALIRKMEEQQKRLEALEGLLKKYPKVKIERSC